MATKRQFDVFISYSSADLDFAKSARTAIRNLGLRPFLADPDLVPGRKLASVGTVLLKTRLVVLLWSEQASASEWVRSEVGAAWGARVPIIPVLLTTGVDLPPPLSCSTVKYLDASKRDIDSILRLQGAVIMWWKSFVDQQAARQAALEQERSQQQSNFLQTALGLGAFGALGYALIKDGK